MVHFRVVTGLANEVDSSNLSSPSLPKLLPSATKLRRLCFYRRLSVHRGGGGVCLSACWDPTHWSRHPPCSRPPGSRHTPPGSRHPPPGRDGHCCGRYASYWNAFLYLASSLTCTTTKFPHNVQ